MGRSDGIGWGTGESIGSDIWDILTPDSPTLLNEPEARHRWADVNERRPGGLTIWRASPQTPPAERNWSAHAFSRDIFINLDLHNNDQGEYPTDILLLNELNLCLVADQRVTARRPIAGTMRRYDGDVITIKTASGKQVTATPNHPILTRHGWLAAGDIHKGSEVLEYAAGDPVLRGRQCTDDVDVPTPISEVFRSLNNRGGVMSRRPGVREDFHGDGRDGYVDVVRANSLLGDTLSKAGQEVNLMVPVAGTMADSFPSEGASLQFSQSDLSAARTLPHLFHASADGRRVIIPNAGGVSTGAGWPSTTLELDDQIRRIGAGESIGAPSPGIAFVQVSDVVVSRYEGHVYNLTTEDHVIVADGIITHNCYERGDNEDDTDPSMWAARYAHLAEFQAQLLTACKERAADRGFTPRWWYPGWAPGHGEYDHADTWGPVAALHDGVILHSYTTAEQITADCLWYADRFPNHPLVVGEWNCSGLGGDWRSASKGQRGAILAKRLDEEERIRSRLQSLCKALPNLSACYFIYSWVEDDSHEHDIKGNSARLALWQPGAILTTDDWEPSKPIKPPVTPPGGTVGDNEMTAAQMGSQVLTVDQLHAKRWALMAAPPLPVAPTFNPDLGFEGFWRRRENAFLGSPITVNEDTATMPDGSTRPARVFVNAVLTWGPNGAEVLE